MAAKESTGSSLFPGLDSRIEIVAVGRWGQKGHVEIMVGGQPLPEVRLSASLWNVLALLIEAAAKSQGRHWATAFLSAATLAAQLHKRIGLSDGDPKNIHRMVNKLRERLNREAKLALGVAGWGSVVIETDVTYGYRVRVAPEALRITLLDDTLHEDDL